jgi:ubiquinone/menaquinone biosynthesis C-methylase UbiE
MTDNDPLYYQIAREANISNPNHPGFKKLKIIARKAKNVLDVGCGEGSHLNLFLSSKQIGTGIDTNQFALNLAKKQYPKHKFIHFSGKNIPFSDDTFNLVYSTFVLEHTTNPEILISEMVRVLEPNGQLVILCPNFGSPNRRSPNSIKNPVRKLIQGFANDLFLSLETSIKQLNWQNVVPKKNYQNIDDDTTTEPYLHQLSKYLISEKLQIIKQSSLWSLETTKHPLKKITAFLGSNSIFPFKFWGPQIFICAKKPRIKSLL